MIADQPFPPFWSLAGVLLAALLAGVSVARADSVVVFNEIHYHPWEAGEPEWIELHNQMAIDVDLSEWRIRGGVDFDFEVGTIVPAGGYLVVSGDPGGLGIGGALGPWTGSLSNGGERLRLRNNSGRLMDELEYGDRGVWPIGPDGSGATLAKFDPDAASGEPANWRASAEVEGTPGRRNFVTEVTSGPEIVLVPFNGSWRFNESGADLGEGWASDSHPEDNTEWFSGAGLLGFETAPDELPEPIGTTLANPTTNSVITYYFETDFVLSASQAENGASLTLRHVIDDGAVFYLNGVEMALRFNLDEGAILASTLANTTVRNAGYVGPVTLPVDALVPGTNRFSVEVHQRTANSNDVVFGVELSMTQTFGLIQEESLVISEIAGSGDADFRLELANASEEELDAGGFVLVSRGVIDESYTLPNPSMIDGQGFLVIEEAVLGFRPADGDRLFLFSPEREALVHAARTDDLPRAWSADHGRHLTPAIPSFGAPNAFSINSEVVINEIMYHFREDPGTQGEGGTADSVELIPIDASWRYNSSGVPFPVGWQASAHPVNGVDWLEGPALFGFDFDVLPEPIRTQFTSPQEDPIVTYYFEKEFSLTAGQLAGPLSLQLEHLIDDGAIFYLNGVEVNRFNMPGGEVTASTHAEPAVRDATYEGPFALPAGSLVAGLNLFSVELHQQSFPSTDIVFGAKLTAVLESTPPRSPQPIVERDEEWVELHNKGASEVDLTGWSLDGGIDFDFPEGTSIPAGGYLVVSNQATSLAAKYPTHAPRIVGDFRNRLNNRSDLIRLEDARENPVDEVRYWEGGRWPGLADGRGSSLELRALDADNANPGAWAASDESAKQGWQTIAYRDTGGQSYGLNDWNEFRVGMLQAGEVLIDDVSVVRDPDGAAQELIQSGSFSAGANRWRLLGNHRHSRVIPEPGNPGNQVLHLVATGAHDTRYNHLETTLLDNTAINSGQTYEVSYRARWLAGSNQLNTRCYYQRLARTTQLARPEFCGTPGAPNSRLEANLGPTFSNLRHHPPVPAADEAITITAEVADPDGLASLVLKSRYNEGPERSHSFALDGNGRGQGTLPGAAAGTVIQFWIEAVDSLGARSMAPVAGPDSRALIQVEDRQGTRLRLQELRVVMLASERDTMLQSLNLMSNDRLGGTAIYNRRTVTYDVMIRLRGSAAGRARDGTNYQGFNVAFPADQPFRGVHASVGIDRSHRSPVVLRPDEIYVKHMFNHAGVPCMYDDLVHLIGPSPTYTGTALLLMASYGSVFTASQFENGGNGSVYNPAATYDPATSIGGVEGLKPPVPFSDIRSDFNDLGESEENYRNLCEIRTGRRRDDFATLIEFCKTISLPSPQLETRIETIMDVDEWMRYAALTVLCGIGDTYTAGCLPCNIRVFAPEEGSGKVVALPWDNDFVFNRGATSGMLPASSNLRRVIDIPKYRRLYWGHVQDLVNRTFNPTYMNRWFDHYGQVIGANLGGQASYLAARGNFALSQLPAQVPFRITTSDGADFLVHGSLAELEGRGWVNLREFRLAGRDDPLAHEWLDEETWRIAIPLRPGANSIDLEIYDFGGTLIHTANLVITNTETEPQPVDYLRITELNYNPAGDEGTEFIELKNIGSQPLAIGGVTFTDGLAFTVPEAATLGPGAFALVVRDRAAFEAVYGAGLPVVGEFRPDNLSNDGERLELRDASGNVIHDFRYSDSWYPATDGGGYSLVVRDETAAVVSWTSAAGWGISGEPAGNPNADNVVFSRQFEGWQRDHFTPQELGMPAVSGLLADANGDGIVNLLKYAVGADPWTPTPPELQPIAKMVDGRLRLQVRLARNAIDLEIAAEFGSNLIDWWEGLEPLGPAVDLGDGTELLIFEDPGPVADPRFGRLRVRSVPP